MMEQLMSDYWIIVLSFLHVNRVNAAIWTIDSSIPNGYNKTFSKFWMKDISLAKCAAECYIRGNCLTIAYTPAQTVCRLYDEEITPQTQLLLSGQVIDFYKAYPCLRPDFDYRPDYNAYIKLYWEVQYVSANATCANEGGQLLVVNTSAIYSLLQQMVAETGEAAWWLGAEQDPNNLSSWYWANGDLITLNNGGQFWYPGFPKVDSGTCMLTKLDQETSQFGLRNVKCNTTHRFMCERPLAFPAMTFH